MGNFIDQRTSIKFCLRNKYSYVVTSNMLRKTIGNLLKWYNEFQAGREPIEDEPGSGQPSTSTDEGHVQEIREWVLENRRIRNPNHYEEYFVSCLVPKPPIKKKCRVEVSKTLLLTIRTP